MSERSPIGASSDRNLLFGILALQMDFVTRDQLVCAMNAWALEKATPLGSVLRAQGALGEEELGLLEALVQKHLQKHGDNAQQSLQALRTIASRRAELKQITDADVQASLAHVAAARTDADDPFATQPPAVGEATSNGTRFRILRPHARGALGAVFLAHDEELRREVALKEIQDPYADDDSSRARFVLEAEITGGLEHPGVVPVYGLGYYADGRPFYAMRFIRGDSLKEAIERFHRADSPARDPGERALALRQLLRRFVDVCNAIAYAHSRGVLHRDLKPGNVMLGQYGETLVVDWGLAKALGRVEERPAVAAPGESPLCPAAASDSEPTRMGAVMGTPAYMSPEQAAGRLDQLGPASDVYSLGATLYSVLTGKTPFGGTDLAELVRKVQLGDFPRPAQVKRGVAPALEAICLKAMALPPAERYPSARALADDVEHWLGDEPVGAWRESLTGRAGRWARRHRPLVAGAAGLLVAATAGLALSTILIGRQQALTEQARADAQANYEAEEKERRRAEDNAVEADRQRRQAQVNAASAEQLRQQAQNNLGVFLYQQGQLDKAEQVFRQALLVQEQLVRDFPTASHREEVARTHYNLGLVQRARGNTSLAEAEYQEATKRYRALVDEFPSVASYRHGLADAQYNLGNLLSDTERKPAAEQAYRQAALRYRALADETPALFRHDAARSLSSLALLLRETRRPAEADQTYRQALQIYRALANQPHETADLLNELGDLLFEMKRPQEAEKAYREALSLYQRLAEAAPARASYRVGLAATHDNLGELWHELGRSKEAEQAYRRALAVRTKLVADFPNEALHQNNLAWLLAACPEAVLRDPARAVEAARQATKLAPAVGSYWNTLGVAQYRAGQAKGASASLEKAVQLTKGGSCADWFFLALAHGKLGNMKEAEAYYDRGVRWLEQNQPENAELRRFRREAVDMLVNAKK